MSEQRTDDAGQPGPEPKKSPSDGGGSLLLALLELLLTLIMPGGP